MKNIQLTYEHAMAALQTYLRALSLIDDNEIVVGAINTADGNYKLLIQKEKE